MPAAADLRGPLTDRRTLNLPQLPINSMRIREGAPQKASAFVLSEGLGISKLGGMSNDPSSLRSFAAQGAFSISSARIMSKTQRASLSGSISPSAFGCGLSSTNHLVACRKIWRLVVLALVRARGSIRGLGALARSQGVSISRVRGTIAVSIRSPHLKRVRTRNLRTQMARVRTYQTDDTFKARLTRLAGAA